MTYIPLLMKITLDIDQPNRQLASNTFDISANPRTGQRAARVPLLTGAPALFS
ncbi:hypothetical protein [Burkholderia contaminans]|uniref:hypothetical protein n=1 Tax=Burkholderia contaminans TaxID=488447 RepID=UPI001CF3A479|nr:hypothetical protein [Burkholderia contaminans]MCA8096427.1 hypothetical protein [Burkholderia contaminans]